MKPRRYSRTTLTLQWLYRAASQSNDGAHNPMMELISTCHTRRTRLRIGTNERRPSSWKGLGSLCCALWSIDRCDVYEERACKLGSSAVRVDAEYENADAEPEQRAASSEQGGGGVVEWELGSWGRTTHLQLPSKKTTRTRGKEARTEILKYLETSQ